MRAWVLSLAVLLVFAPAAGAAISFDPGANKVTTPRLEVDFGPGNGNVERIDSLRWRTSAGTLGPDLAFNGGPDCSDAASAWGYGLSRGAQPDVVGGGSAGTWTVRGHRTIEITSQRPIICTGNVVVPPVRTRYTFFDASSSGGSRMRVERRFGFNSASPSYSGASVRPFMPSLPSDFDVLFWPNALSNNVVMDSPKNPATFDTDWNDTWLALHNPGTNAGVVILRDATTSATPAARTNLALDADSGSSGANSSSVEIQPPTSSGHKAPFIETEFVCFYDAVTWPDPQAGPTVLPSQCAAARVPINVTTPSISGTPRVATELTANPGAWDYSSGLTYQWIACTGGACSPIAGATGQKYTVRDADSGKQIRVDVTATATGGERDTASSPLTNGVATGPPTNTGLPAISGDPRDDETLSVDTGSWTGSPTSYAIQWLRCRGAGGEDCSDIAGQTAATYKATRDDVGSTLRVRVRATNGVGTSPPVVSAPTGVVQPLVISARFRSSPEPTCTGISTSLNASDSKTPNGPIVRYRWTYREFPVGLIFVAIFSGDLESLINQRPVNPIATETDPIAETTWNWNRQTLPNERPPGYVRDPAVVTLEITDRAGATATAMRLVTFGQYYSANPRDACPRLAGSLRSRVGVATRVSLGASAIAATLPCRSRVACASQVSYVSRFGVGGAGRRARVLARSRLVQIRPRRSKRVRARLTRAGRRALRGRRQSRATVRVRSVNALGRASTKSYRVTLRRPGRR